jgi:hypothetical protein
LEYWTKETEQKIKAYQITKDEKLFNDYILPALSGIAVGLMCKYQFKCKLWSEDELILLVLGDIVLSDSINKWQTGNCFAYFTTCVKNKFIDEVRKDTHNKKEYNKISLDKLIDSGYNI